MEIKAYSFEHNSHAFADIKRSVAEIVDKNAVYFESFSDPKELFTKMGEVLSETDVILIGVESKIYLKFKPIFIKAFNLTPAYSSDIDKAIGDTISDDKLKKAHSLVPNECTELISADGLYSGFYIKDEEQHIVVFPLIETIVPDILQKSNLPFFIPAEEKEIIFKDIKSTSTSSEKAAALIDKLTKNNLRIAIPSTPAAKMLKEDIKATENHEDNVFFTPFVNDTGIEDPKQYCAQLAKGAMELRTADLGAAISNIFREKNGDKIVNYYAFVSVSTADKVVVKKLFADTGESIDNLIVEATNELYSMINKYADETLFKMSASADEVAKYEQSLIEAEVISDIKPSEKKGKKGKIIAAIILIIAIALCVVLGLYFGGYFVKPSDNPGAESLQNVNTVAPSAPTTAPKPSVTIAELTDLPSETIFGVTTTAPTAPAAPGPNTNYNIIYTPNTNTGANSTTAPATTAPATTAPVAPPTTQPQTAAPAQTTEMIGDVVVEGAEM
ncbi:MAG: hypothetical protein J6D06_00395 [Clostridia bacterium]|nr:hypothetical protein [Clostridia bacterium]